jgi:alpha-tubulin suppressor-like RCC1 family protein
MMLAGDVFTWGCNLLNQCGTGSRVDLPSPQKVSSLAGVPIVAVAAGLNHSIALSMCGDLYSWGANECGQLGLGSIANVARPCLVDASVMEDKVVAQVACGSRCASLSLLACAHSPQLTCVCSSYLLQET